VAIIGAMRFEAVFFDAGETLVHPHPTFPDLFAEILQREGHDVDAQTIRDRMHVVFDRFKQAADTNELWTTSKENSRRFWHDVYTIFFADLGISDPDLIDTVYREFTNPANYAMFDDVLPVLDKLRGSGLKLGVVSNFEIWLGRLLDDLGLAPFFAVRVISAVEGLEKPDPRIFRLAMDRARVAPEVSVYVGDDPVFDIEPAAALGMFPVLIDRRERFPDTDGARIVSMEELPALLGI
jgi:putative hydrolase of the HAD superfamily